MRITQRIGSVEVSVDGESLTEAFDQLAAATEILGNTVCGACGKADVQFVTRQNDGYTFREVECVDCGCRLAIGMTKAGGLYPRRKEKSGKWLPDGGWVRAPQSASDVDAF